MRFHGVACYARIEFADLLDDFILHDCWLPAETDHVVTAIGPLDLRHQASNFTVDEKIGGEQRVEERRGGLAGELREECLYVQFVQAFSR